MDDGLTESRTSRGRGNQHITVLASRSHLSRRRARTRWKRRIWNDLGGRLVPRPAVLSVPPWMASERVGSGEISCLSRRRHHRGMASKTLACVAEAHLAPNQPPTHCAHAKGNQVVVFVVRLYVRTGLTEYY